MSVRRGVKVLCAAALLACVLLPMVHSGRATAAPNQGPDPADFTESNRYGNSYVGAGRTVDYVVATSAYNNIPTTTLKIYMPTPTGQVLIHNQNMCYGTFRNGGRNYDQVDDGVVNSAGNVVSYNLSGSTQWGSWDGSAGCDGKFLTFNVSGASLDPSTNMYTYLLTVNAGPAVDLYMNTFWVTAPAGSYVSQDSSKPSSSFGMNQTSPIPPGSNPITQSPPDPYKDYSNYIIRFAPDCTVTTPTVVKRIEIFDDDNHNNWDVQPRPFLIKLREYDRSGTFLGEPTPTITLPDGGGTWANVGGGYYDVYGGGNAHRIWLDYTLNRDHIYQWWVDSVYYDNTLQFKIPFDNVFYYQPCQTNNFNLQPTVNVAINGGATPGNVAEVGDNVTFTYAVNNTGPTGTTSIACNIYGKTYTNYQSLPAPPDSSSDVGYVPPGTGCPRTFPAGPSNTTLTSETITASTANRTICRALWVNPATPAGPSAGVEACALVASKPYARVYGGDAAAGGGFITAPSTCTNNAAAAVVGWNKEGAGGYAGAGVQYAAFALSQIYDTATALGGGAASTPGGLAFANTTASGVSIFGGSLGTVPCIPDYYGQKPATATPQSSPINLSSLTTGSYSAVGPVTVHGNINPNQRTVLYVQGDVLIDGNVTFPGSWATSSMPLFELIASGNVYVSQSVTQLDGVYVAEPSGAGTGIIYTCANPTLPATAISTVGGAIYSPCSTKLTVNGSFVASQVQLLRTNGSLRQSNAAESGAAGSAAEVFNYNPAAWMPIPPDQGGQGQYDAVTSLPPIL